MKTILINLAFISGVTGFILFLFILLEGYIGCCFSINVDLFNRIAITALVLSVLLIGYCMYRRCYKIKEK